MSISRKWNSHHYRRGSWIKSHQRAKGVVVKRHWRGEHEVKGHFSAFITKQLSLEYMNRENPITPPDNPTQLSLLAALKKDTDEKERPRYDNEVLHEADGQELEVTAIIWTTDTGKTELARDNINIPTTARNVTIMGRTKDGKNITLQADVFHSANGATWVRPETKR